MDSEKTFQIQKVQGISKKTIPLSTPANNRKRKRSLNSQQDRRTKSISRRLKNRYNVHHRDLAQQQQ
jgi:hypothetical protein